MNAAVEHVIEKVGIYFTKIFLRTREVRSIGLPEMWMAPGLFPIAALQVLYLGKLYLNLVGKRTPKMEAPNRNLGRTRVGFLQEATRKSQTHITEKKK